MKKLFKNKLLVVAIVILVPGAIPMFICGSLIKLGVWCKGNIVNSKFTASGSSPGAPGR